MSAVESAPPETATMMRSSFKGQPHAFHSRKRLRAKALNLAPSVLFLRKLIFFSFAHAARTCARFSLLTTILKFRHWQLVRALLIRKHSNWLRKGFDEMKVKNHLRGVAASASLLACCALFLLSAAAAHAQQPEGRRGPRGAVAGPAIKLPRGEGANTEQRANGGDENARANAAPQRWEYCSIVGFKRLQKGFSLSAPSVPAAVVRYFPNSSEEVEGTSEDDALANAFAKLGDEGWELAGIKTDFNLNDGNGKTTATFYFKRLKQQE